MSRNNPDAAATVMEKTSETLALIASDHSSQDVAAVLSTSPVGTVRLVGLLGKATEMVFSCELLFSKFSTTAFAESTLTVKVWMPAERKPSPNTLSSTD